MDINKLFREYEKALQDRNSFQDLMIDVYRYCIPSRNGWINQTSGQRNDIVIYNSHPVNSTKQFASNMVSMVIPSGLKFFNLKSSKQLNDVDREDFNKLVAPISSVIFEYLSDSNLSIALNEAFIDLGAGTGGVLCKYSGNDKEPLIFNSLDMSNICFTDGINGIIDNVFYEMNDIEIDIAEQLYPDANFPIGNNRVSFLVSIYKEKDIYNYILIDKNSKQIYWQKQQNYNPFIIFRWNKLANEIRGRGVLADMISTIKTANIMVADILTASAKIIAPPTFVYSNSLINPSNIDFSPNSIVPLKYQAGISNPVFNMPFNGNIPFAMAQVENMNKQLDDAFMINPLGNVGISQQTATEITARLRFASNIWGAFYARFQKEFLSPLVNNTINILTMRGLIPKLPDGIKIQYQSPIIELQKQAELTKLMQATQLIAQIAGDNANQAIMTSLDVAKLPNYIAEHLGADMGLFRTTAEIQESMGLQQKILQQMALSGKNIPLAGSPINTNIPNISQ